MSYDSTIAYIKDPFDFASSLSISINPISIPSSLTSMADNNESHNKENLLTGLRPLREHLASERKATPSCIHIPPHIGTLHF